VRLCQKCVGQDGEHLHLFWKFRGAVLFLAAAGYVRGYLDSAISPGLIMLVAGIVALLIMSMRNKKKTPESKL
jgi:hypothetical protein